MVELFEEELKHNEIHSSKGNQLKWYSADSWYKADYTGYEGLAEYVVSHLLEYSSLNKSEYVIYNQEQIKYKTQNFNGVKSLDFLKDDWQIITLERLFKSERGISLYEAVWKIEDVKERISFLVNQVEQLTGLTDFGVYISKLLTIDAITLNEDRHMHNIAVLMNSAGEYELCPIFDNGAALLSDTSLDYPLSEDVYHLMSTVKAKTVSRNFDEQLDAVEDIYGENLFFTCSKKDVDSILDSVTNYDKKEVERVRDILHFQMNKYKYLFR